MAKEDPKKQTQQGQEVSRSQKSQEGVTRGGYMTGLSPAEFFRMGPFHLMKRMNEEMARMFGELTGSAEGALGGFAPPIEVMERDGNYVVRAELPGVNAKDISLKITEDAVVIEGEHQVQHDETKGGVHVSECRYGRFYRAIPLPEGTKADQATANFENGVLEVKVPVTAKKSQGRQIPIQSSQPAQGAAGSTDKAA